MNGKVKVIKNDQIKFFYRGCNLPDNLIILSAKFKGKLSKKESIQKKQLELIQRKKNSQPSQIKTCGSTFKNPKDKKAWKLIKDSNCDKLSVGAAKISDKHCNFFVNTGNATSHDIEELIRKVKKEVFDKTAVNLELEIKLIGKK
jgi:UDP-N-acetylmuramate dehydrogenase